MRQGRKKDHNSIHDGLLDLRKIKRGNYTYAAIREKINLF
jgi:hypothetical protein